jgi:hypothetical protein
MPRKASVTSDALRIRKSRSGSHGIWKNSTYQERSRCRQPLRITRSKTAGCGRFITTRRESGRIRRSAKYHAITPPQSCAKSTVSFAPEASIRPATSSISFSIAYSRMPCGRSLPP